jgi:N-acetylglucosamine-6-phosphate deacetylase
VSKYLALGPDGFGSYDVDLQQGSFRRTDETAERLLVPGFVDVHIHGGFGIDFMSSASDADVAKLCRKLEAVGYEGLLPTTVTATPQDVKRALKNLPEDEAVLGFHLEGPFISRKYPGAQPQSAIAEIPDGPSEWDDILDDPRLRLITLAPELPGADALIRRLTARGVTVSMGHTDATFAQATASHEAGLRHATHTYNAMRPLHHREAGSVGFAMTCDGLDAELIYDRLHVSPQAAAVLVRSKPIDRVIAVSDSTMAAGLPPGQMIEMWGLECVVGQGQVRLKDGTLAGSAITLLDAFRNLYQDFGPEVAIHACSLNPRRALGLNDTPRVWVEFDQDLNLLDRHRQVRP